MDLDKNTSQQIEELQSLEKNLQNLLMQKQAVQIELNEASNAVSELKNTKENEVFRLIGNIMLKSDKNAVLKELEEKTKIGDLRINSLEKQEKALEEKAEKLREEVSKVISRLQK